MAKKIIERRTLSNEDLRKLCTQNNWYTCGNNEEYGKMLRLANECKNVDAEVILTIAENILRHSDTEYPLESICFEIGRACNSFFSIERS